MELRDYLRVLAKHWFAILLASVVGLAMAVVMTFTAPKIYSATAQTFIAISSPTGAGVSALAPDATYTLQRIQSYIQIVGSPDVLQPVIDDLGLEMSVEALKGRVSATNPVDTVLINVSVSDTNPQQAATVANAVAVQLGAVIQKLETSISGDVVPVKATLTDPADPPGAPSSPRTSINLMMGLLIGLALGVVYALLRETLDTTVKSPDDLQDATGLAPLGVVAFDPEAKKQPLAALEQRATRAEAFRAIRTNLQYVDVDNPPKIIAVTSAIPGEGKTTTSINLAITMAQAGWRVALVETDLRRPKASSYLGVESELGLTDVLAARATLADAMIPWSRGLLDFLPAGHTPPNPSELLGSHQFEQVLEVLRGQYDYVVIDSAPLLPVTDGAIVSKAADGAFIVVRFGKTTRDQLATAVAALDQVGAKVLGTALNFVPTGRRGYGYKYGYKYGFRYGYGYGYGASEYKSQGIHAEDSSTAD